MRYSSEGGSPGREALLGYRRAALTDPTAASRPSQGTISQLRDVERFESPGIRAAKNRLNSVTDMESPHSRPRASSSMRSLRIPINSAQA